MKNWLVLLGILLLGGLAACGDSGSNGDVPRTIDPSTLQGQLDSFDSYRSTIYILVKPDVGDAQGVDVELSVVKDPPAKRIIFNLEGPQAVAELNSMEFVEIGSDIYINLPQLGCMKETQETLGELGSPTQGLPTADQLLSTLSSAERVTPDETVNGVLARHYVFDEKDIENGDSVESLEGHLYVAADSGYLIRLTMKGRGSASFIDPTVLTTGAFEVDMNVLDINTPMVIEPMEGCDVPFTNQ